MISVGNRWVSAALRGALGGIVVAALLSALIAAWDWWDNPAGLFRSGSQTQWAFVWDTFISWFAPTLPSFSLTGIGAMLARQWWRR